MTFETSIENARSVGKRIAYPSFFLFLGTVISLVVAAMSGAILTVCALGLRLIGDWLTAAKLVNYAWFILGPFILIWFTSAYGTGHLYINKFSEIAHHSRFRASCFLLVPGVLIWLTLFALLTFVFTEYPRPDSWMTFFIPLSCLVNIAGQIVAVNIIREQATQPITA